MQFPSHRIIKSEILCTRDRHPVYNGYGASPMFYSYGASRTFATLELSELTFEEFAFINKLMETAKEVGPIKIKNVEMDSVIEIYGIIRGGTGNRNGTASIDIDITNMNILQRERGAS